MISRVLTAVFLLNLWAGPALAQAEAITLSITPPLIKANIVPGQLWRSSVKVVNNNSEDIEVYVQALDFRGSGEDGSVVFIEGAGREEENDYLLSRWISLPEDKISLPAGKSHEVPFIVEVPDGAAPGGHYAALLIGTKPPKDEISGASIKISSLLASLIMLNVSGEVVENARIREFSTDKSVYGTGKAGFKVRFENLGNVHVQPRGEIRIFDMWGNSSGVIKMNHATEFGNVLPGDTRSWDFVWEDKIGLAEMGRYRAELVLSYGDKAKETLTQARYFWIFLYRPLGLIAGLLALFMLAVYLLVRRSVRKAIRETGKMAGLVYPADREAPGVAIAAKENNQNGAVVVNLKNKAAATAAGPKRRQPGPSWKTFKQLAFFLLVLALLAAAGVAAGRYWILADRLPAADPPPAVEIVPLPESAEPAAEAGGAAEEESMAIPAAEEESAAIPAAVSVVVLNGSGRPGAAARAEKLLEQAGFMIGYSGNADNFDYQSTLIRYSEEAAAAARRIADLFPDPVELEAFADAAGVIVITGPSF